MGTLVLAGGAVTCTEVTEQTREHRLVYAVGVALRHASAGMADTQLAGDLAQLAEQIVPLAHAQVVEVFATAQLAELAAVQRLLLFAQVVPQLHKRQEVAAGNLEAAVQFVGCNAMFGGALTRVLNAERSSDHQHLAHTAVAVGLQHHPPQAWVDGQACEPCAQRCQPLCCSIDRAELLQKGVAVTDRARVGRIEEREGPHVAETEGRHLQDHRREVGAQDLGFRELGALGEVVLVVEADANTGCDTATTTSTLVGRGLRHRFDG
ncbi:unannotated protein [freshwater metagenome]|uniref:Unannotated protein n=1 Tax=freshwater metagenome TaxID=449393 RepID=A0A6J6ZT42_9ZZZZ